MDLSSSLSLRAHGSLWFFFACLMLLKFSNSDMVLTPELLGYFVLLVLLHRFCHVCLPIALGIMFLSSAWYVQGIVSQKNMLPVAGKAVFITGCDSGLGRAADDWLDSMGFKVIASVLNLESPGARDLQKQCLQRRRIIQMDLTKSGDIQKAQKITMIGTAVTRLWALVNNAGYCANFGDAELSLMSTYRGCMEMNFFGTLGIIKAMLAL
ncbi:hypothetical protein FKM82_012740 [Ascaphus truei]